MMTQPSEALAALDVSVGKWGMGVLANRGRVNLPCILINSRRRSCGADRTAAHISTTRDSRKGHPNVTFDVTGDPTFRAVPTCRSAQSPYADGRPSVASFCSRTNAKERRIGTVLRRCRRYGPRSSTSDYAFQTRPTTDGRDPDPPCGIPHIFSLRSVH
jgi:hypothetical protein